MQARKASLAATHPQLEDGIHDELPGTMIGDLPAALNTVNVCDAGFGSDIEAQVRFCGCSAKGEHVGMLESQDNVCPRALRGLQSDSCLE